MKKSAALNILGIAEGASDDEVKAAHRKLIIAHHPDKFPLDSSQRSEAEELTKQINEARDVLLNQSWTPEYDPRRDGYASAPHPSQYSTQGGYDPFAGQPFGGQPGRTTYVWTSWDDIRTPPTGGSVGTNPFDPFRAATRKTPEEIKAEALDSLKKEGLVIGFKVVLAAVFSAMGLLSVGLFAYLVVSLIYGLWKSMRGCLVVLLVPLSMFIGWFGINLSMRPSTISLGLALSVLLAVYYDVKTIRDLTRVYGGS